jgi:hypothetical protein
MDKVVRLIHWLIALTICFISIIVWSDLIPFIVQYKFDIFFSHRIDFAINIVSVGILAWGLLIIAILIGYMPLAVDFLHDIFEWIADLF